MRFSKSFVATACALLIVSTSAFAKSSRAPRALHRPLIVGASVSSGLVTMGPGDRAARRFTTEDMIVNRAANGREACSDPAWSAAALDGFTSVIAVDYLFWDTRANRIDDSIKALRSLIQACHQAHIPLVLGDVPNLLFGQDQRDAINAAIRRTCRPAFGCHLLQFDRLHGEAYYNGVLINGERYYYSDLTFDGLHLNALGAEYVASMIIGLLD